jgi:hypothetical protein
MLLLNTKEYVEYVPTFLCINSTPESTSSSGSGCVSREDERGGGFKKLGDFVLGAAPS